MVDTTTALDLAEKIEWVGFRNLSNLEKRRVQEDLVEVSSFLPRVLALTIWRFYGLEIPEELKTKSAKDSLSSYIRRDNARREILKILEGC
ncbi:hypothetical protein MLD52_05630 [Puniceicoccaceae bacterium K14]|nr:hypothetical protein [Puniceicoccaceae bacterium K14]